MAAHSNGAEDPPGLGDALKIAPQVASQTFALGESLINLAWEKPDQVLDVVKTAMATGEEAAELVMSEEERPAVKGVVEHGRQGLTDVLEFRQQAPSSVQSTVSKGIAAVSDLVTGVTTPSAVKLGASAVETIQSAGSASAAAVSAPLTTLDLVKQTTLAAANTATVPFRAPAKAAKTAWQSTRAARSAAGLIASSPRRSVAALASAVGAARQVGSAAGVALSLAGRLPGGKLAYGAILGVMGPWMVWAAMIGLMLGAGWEMGARTVNYVASFTASCVATAAGVVAGRLQVVSGPALLGSEDTLRKGDKEDPKAKAVSLTERANSLVLTSAREALLEARERLEQEARGRNTPLHMVGGALAAATRRTRRVLRKVGGKLAFWRPDDRGPSPAPPVTSPVSERATTSEPAGSEPVTSADISMHQEALASYTGVSPSAAAVAAPAAAAATAAAQAPLLLVPSISSSEASSTGTGGAVSTPAGDLLPFLALGMEGTPYALPSPHRASRVSKAAPSTLGEDTAAHALAPGGVIVPEAKQLPAILWPAATLYSIASWTWEWVAITPVWLAIAFSAFVDSWVAVGRAAIGKEGGESVVERARRVVALVLQPVVLWVALVMAVIDTGIWMGRGMIRAALGPFKVAT